MSFGLIAFTNRGKALQAKAQAGAELTFTRIAVGDGQLSGQSIADLTALIHEIKSIELNKFKTLSGGKAVVGGVLSNQDLMTGFWWRELGLFAQDPDLGEILYCYGNAGELAEYIPSPGGSEILEKQVDIVSIIGNASNVSAEIDQSLVYETPAGAQAKADAAAAAAIAAHEEDPDPHEQYALDVDLAALQDEINDHKDENATEAKKGHVELATTTEATTGTDTERAVTAAGVKAHMDNRVKTFSVTLDTTWSGSSAPFSKTVTVSGILATDTPIVDVVMSGTYATDQDRQKAWSKIYRIVTANNQITLYASVKPTVSLPIQLKVVR